MATDEDDVMVATLRARMDLGIHHLLAAARMGARLRAIEHDHHDEPFGEFWDEILHFGLGVAVLSVASLESYANELLGVVTWSLFTMV